MTTAGFADETPVADNTSEAGRARNRRVEIVRR
jgi:flagellar motor protein MotB